MKKKEKHFCPVCGKECKKSKHYTKTNPKYESFCSKECRLSEEGKKITKQKREQTNIERFGTTNPFKSKTIQEKIKKKCKEKYGVEYPLQSDEIKEKYNQTCIIRYGVKNPKQNETIKEKAKQTNFKIYGAWASQTDEFKKRVKKTNIRKFGYEYVLQMEKTKENARIKRRERNFEIFKTTLDQRGYEILFSYNDYINAVENSELIFKCRTCGKEFKYIMKNNVLHWQFIHCPFHTHKTNSYCEQEIYDWLISIGITNIERNKRDWEFGRLFEADIYLPDYKLAIEYNGLYWHSNLNKDKNYHFNKWKFFKDQNIDCIQIFENEWMEGKKEIVKSIILNKLGKNKRIFARKCIVKEIPNNEYELFLEQNHIQGYCHAKVKLGLYFENNLVELMSFSKPRFNKKYDWENIRTCIRVGYYVIGGFSKLLNYFKKNYNGSIISYIDSRYFNGKGYLKNNFQNTGHSNPNYFYYKHGKLELYNRIDFQKHKLKDKLEIYDENLSEQENMSMNNYEWIYDCGNDVLVSE